MKALSDCLYLREVLWNKRIKKTSNLSYCFNIIKIAFAQILRILLVIYIVKLKLLKLYQEKIFKLLYFDKN